MEGVKKVLTCHITNQLQRNKILIIEAYQPWRQLKSDPINWNNQNGPQVTKEHNEDDKRTSPPIAIQSQTKRPANKRASITETIRIE